MTEPNTWHSGLLNAQPQLTLAYWGFWRRPRFALNLGAGIGNPFLVFYIRQGESCAKAAPSRVHFTRLNLPRPPFSPPSDIKRPRLDGPTPDDYRNGVILAAPVVRSIARTSLKALIPLQPS